MPLLTYILATRTIDGEWVIHYLGNKSNTLEARLYAIESEEFCPYSGVRIIRVEGDSPATIREAMQKLNSIDEVYIYNGY